jgi:hypothetical protein
MRAPHERDPPDRACTRNAVRSSRLLIRHSRYQGRAISHAHRGQRCRARRAVHTGLLLRQHHRCRNRHAGAWSRSSAPFATPADLCSRRGGAGRRLPNASLDRPPARSPAGPRGWPPRLFCTVRQAATHGPRFGQSRIGARERSSLRPRYGYRQARLSLGCLVPIPRKAGAGWAWRRSRGWLRM